MNFKKIYINGQWVEPKSKKFIEVEDPVTKKIIESVPASNEEDVNCAILAAKEAFKTWRYTDVSTRIEIMERAHEIFKKNRDIIVETIMKELGINRSFAESTHVDLHIKNMLEYIDIAKNFKYEDMEKEDLLVVKEPIGVVGAIAPWNYPMGQIMTKIVPGILAGCTIVLKPSKETPLTAYYIVDAFHQAGLPKGVLNLVPGRGGEVGNVLSKSKDVDMISFTGSTKGGLEVNVLAAETCKKVVLELGGKSATILLDREHLEEAVRGTIKRVYNNVGQTCSAWTRFLIPKELKEEVENMILKVTDEYSFGDPRKDKDTIGPLSSKKQFEKVTGYIKEGIKEGARLLVGKENYTNDEAYYVQPTVFTDVENNMKIAQEEIFGPVLCLITYRDKDEAIKIANDTIYGLSGAVYGNRKEAVEVAKKMDAGEIVINGKFTSTMAPFGGYKYSGIGREKGYYGFIEYLQVKSIEL